MKVYNKVNLTYIYGFLNLLSPKKLSYEKKEKNFDALAFKEKAQKRLYLATKGMTWEEEVKYYHQKALEGPFAKLAQGEYKTYPPKVAKASESPAKYR